MANNDTNNSNHLFNDDDPKGNVCISMVSIVTFPIYGVSIPLNITVENLGSNAV